MDSEALVSSKFNDNIVSSDDEMATNVTSISSKTSDIDDEMIVVEGKGNLSKPHPIQVCDKDKVMSSLPISTELDDRKPLLSPTLTFVKLVPFYFSHLPFTWFENQTRLAEANIARSTKRSTEPVEYLGHEMLMLNRSTCGGSIDDNLRFLKESLINVHDEKKRLTSKLFV